LNKGISAAGSPIAIGIFHALPGPDIREYGVFHTHSSAFTITAITGSVDWGSMGTQRRVLRGLES
jgi:hypothetical protein